MSTKQRKHGDIPPQDFFQSVENDLQPAMHKNSHDALRNLLEDVMPIVYDVDKLVKFNKKFLIKDKELYSLPEEEINGFCQKFLIEYSDKDHPRPCMKFSQAKFPPYILSILSEQKFSAPTPIQSACWHCILQGRDVIGLAKTGSGKTLAYVLPSIIHICAQPYPRTGEGPIALILAPTRELAEQIQKEFSRFGDVSRVTSLALFGGIGKNDQARELARLPQMVVATPGRLIDFIVAKKINLSRVTYLVLDEADKMLDMGLGPQIKAIVSQLRPDRQTLLFSATWPAEMAALCANGLLMDPLKVEIGGTHTLTVAENIKQSFEFCDEQQKPEWLFRFVEMAISFLRAQGGKKEEDAAVRKKEKEGADDATIPRVLVFCTTKREVQSLEQSWPHRDIRVGMIHGDMAQTDRQAVLDAFRSGRVNVLLATDVAARGLDIPDISYVVNYSFPTYDPLSHTLTLTLLFSTIENYVHRIGRTGRAGKSGQSFTLFTPEDAKVLLSFSSTLSLHSLLLILLQSSNMLNRKFLLFFVIMPEYHEQMAEIGMGLSLSLSYP